MKNQELKLVPLFEKFIRESENGKRLKKNANRLKSGTIGNYWSALNLLVGYEQHYDLVLRIKPLNRAGMKERETERIYWRKFYNKFTTYLYATRKCHDLYVGRTFKVVRAFFNYLKTDKLIETGEFYKEFYIAKEEIPVITLSQEQLQFLIFDKAFNKKLPETLKASLDVFIVGCTVALRASDLFNLYPKDIIKINENYYLKNRSQKTDTSIQVRLPDYVVEILRKHKSKSAKQKIFKSKTLSQFNKHLKLIAEFAGWTHIVGKQRSKQGKIKEINLNGSKGQYRFCDLISSHIMRRTAVTTMLILGVPEQIVRKVSGHSSTSTAFYRYVNFAQSIMDCEINKFHQRMNDVA